MLNSHWFWPANLYRTLTFESEGAVRLLCCCVNEMAADFVPEIDKNMTPADLFSYLTRELKFPPNDMKELEGMVISDCGVLACIN